VTEDLEELVDLAIAGEERPGAQQEGVHARSANEERRRREGREAAGWCVDDGRGGRRRRTCER